MNKSGQQTGSQNLAIFVQKHQNWGFIIFTTLAQVAYLAALNFHAIRRDINKARTIFKGTKLDNKQGVRI